MQHDDLIWSVIGNTSHCSYRAKVTQTKENFCRNQYNLTGLCNRSSCPLANSNYATVKEIEGKCYLYIKTIERAHTPKNLWEKILLPRNYTQALGIIDKHLQYWSQFIQLKVKQRLTKIHQYLIRMRRLRKKTTSRIVSINKKVEKRERTREQKALKAALVEKAIEKELLERLKQGTYGEIYNFPSKEYESALDQVEEDIEEEEEEAYDDDYEEKIEFVEGPIDSDDDSDIEDFDSWANNNQQLEVSSSSSSPQNGSTTKKRVPKGAPKAGKDVKKPSKKKKKPSSGPFVEIEYEQEEDHVVS